MWSIFDSSFPPLDIYWFRTPRSYRFFLLFLESGPASHSSWQADDRIPLWEKYATGKSDRYREEKMTGITKVSGKPKRHPTAWGHPRSTKPMVVKQDVHLVDEAASGVMADLRVLHDLLQGLITHTVEIL